ncbi:trfA family protein [Burkholderia pseudomallei ABCPW 107]|uniref:plasmid replication initiator TrfA n=1 Tax=Burkholderia pseudomallei TaxID=28450 RepID=UPI0005320F7F|nr:plasmid replication initiator TrfA [Burkholderia pseudomallei]KGS45061.1 trfA family protein [Burkholderia pseudomallei ABCPW 107]
MTALQNASPVTWPKLRLKHGLNNNLVTAHALARSAIFSTRFYRSHAERPLYRERTRLPSTSDIEVFQTAGHQLDQGDADVFYELLRRVFADGNETCRESHVVFGRAELLRALDRSAGGKTRKLLDESLDRLYHAEFEFSVPGLFSGKSRLILKMHRLEKRTDAGEDYDVLLDVELARLFDGNRWTVLRQSQRRLLDGKPLAKGLHAYFSTLLTPHPMLPETLLRLMGRQGMQLSKGLDVLLPALAHVKLVTGWAKCELETQGVHAGKIVVERGGRSTAPLAKPQTRNAVSKQIYEHDFNDDI